jgi:uncharacterized surface protein with fasciclin (FAS1) repeats
MRHNKSSFLRQITALVATLGCGAIVLQAHNTSAATPQISGASNQPLLLAQVGVLNNIATELAFNSGAFSTLLAAAKAAGLDGALATGGPYTIFAPTNEAFAALPAGTVPNLLRSENRAQLTSILTYHVVPGRISSLSLAPGSNTTVRTLQGKTLRVSVNATGEITVNGARVVLADIAASNGIIHGIQGVLLP